MGLAGIPRPKLVVNGATVGVHSLSRLLTALFLDRICFGSRILDVPTFHDRLDVENAGNRKVLSFLEPEKLPWRGGCPCLISVLTAHGKAGKNQSSTEAFLGALPTFCQARLILGALDPYILCGVFLALVQLCVLKNVHIFADRSSVLKIYGRSSSWWSRKSGQGTQWPTDVNGS